MTTSAEQRDRYMQQLRTLYFSLCSNHEHFEEFRTLLADYDVGPVPPEQEPPAAAAVRARLNERIRSWVGGTFDGLSAVQVLLWRAILIEDQGNSVISPWKDATY